MAFKIVIEINENEMRVEDIRSTASYIGETLRVMGHSYSMNCLMDDIKLMRRKSP